MSERMSNESRKRSSRPIRLEGARSRALEMARNRLLVTGAVFALSFLSVAVRLIDLTVFDRPADSRAIAEASRPAANRGDIVDRNGILLATSLPTASLFADPGEVIDPESAADKLVAVFPELHRDRLVAKLSGKGRFVWIRRNLTPDEQYAVSRLGIPGVDFQDEERRVYPHGRTAAHVLGLTDVDGYGIAGIEQSLNRVLSAGETVRLSIDLRVQAILREQLSAAVREFRAVGAAGLVLDAYTGEVVATVSLPDFDPNVSDQTDNDRRFNRVTTGVYEMGSTFKLFTVAMALDSGTTTMTGGYDASRPIRVASYTISDYHAKNRWLSVPEILVHSSNIGAAQMAVDVGGVLQREYLGRLGLLSRTSIELPERGLPLKPAPWREINVMTVGFGHGIAVSPLQLGRAVAAVVNGGVLRPSTILSLDGAPPPAGERVFSAKTSKQMRELMRMVVADGTGGKADVPGYNVGGKTGTAEKLIGGRYQRKRLISSFVGAFPMDAPQYVVLAMLDEPKGNTSTHNFATGGWVAAPAVGRVIARMAPVVALKPMREETQEVAQWRPSAPPPQKPLFISVRKAISDVRRRDIASN